jgi:hypothetical protein
MTAITASRPWPVTPRPANSRRLGPQREASRRAVPQLSSPACAGTDTALFFPDSTQGAAAAKAICQGCPARAACLQGAIDRGEQHGVWGGAYFEGKERREIARRAAAAKPVRAAAGEPAVQAAGSRMPRNLPPMDKAEWLGRLRPTHGSIRAIAKAAGVGKATAAMYLDLLELDPGSQARVRAGTLYPEAAAAAVRVARGGRRRAS